MRRWSLLFVAALALFAAACGGSDEASSSTSSACLESAEAYLEALEGPLDDVLVDGITPIGACLPREQEPGKIADVGALMIAAARKLNRQVRQAPLAAPAGQLGYLVGAVKARAEQTGGIHKDLALRVEREALFLPAGQTLPGQFQQRYEYGVAAGRRSVGEE